MFSRILNINGSPTVGWDMKMRKFAVKHPETLNLSVGQPDIEMPRCVKSSLTKVVDMKGVNKYTSPRLNLLFVFPRSSLIRELR